MSESEVARDLRGAVLDGGHQPGGVDGGYGRVRAGPGHHRVGHGVAVDVDDCGRNPGGVTEDFENERGGIDENAGRAEGVFVPPFRNRLQPLFELGGDAEVVGVEIEARELEVREAPGDGSGDARVADVNVLESLHVTELGRQSAAEVGVMRQVEVTKPVQLGELGGNGARQIVAGQSQNEHLFQVAELRWNRADQVVLSQFQILHPAL